MTKLKTKIKAIIFDMDGTIIDTERAWRQATKDVLVTRGFSSFDDKQTMVLASLSGIGLLEAAKVIKKAFDLNDSIETLAMDTKRAAHNFFENELDFIEGFEAFHKKLQHNMIPTSIATNADQASLTLLNNKLNLHRFFGQNLYSIETVGNKAKPNPDIFLHAAKQLQVEPHECVVFEDSLFGFQAAQKAGMKCIAIKNSINHNSLKLAHHAITSYHEAEEALSIILK